MKGFFVTTSSGLGFKKLGALLLFLLPGGSVALLLIALLSFLAARLHGGRMKYLFASSLLLLVSAQAKAGEDWEPVSNDGDLALYEREVSGSDIVAFKFEGELAAPMDRVAAVILDYRRTVEWVDHLEDDRLLRQVSPTEFVEYTHIGTPFAMKDRDFVIRVRVQFSRVDRALVIAQESTEDASAPDHGYVRGNLLGSTFQLTAVDREHTRLSGEIHADPMGSVPKWIVNLFQKKWPRTTFDHIQEQLKKTDLSVPAEFSDIVSEIRGLVWERPLPVDAIKAER